MVGNEKVTYTILSLMIQLSIPLLGFLSNILGLPAMLTLAVYAATLSSIIFGLILGFRYQGALQIFCFGLVGTFTWLLVLDLGHDLFGSDLVGTVFRPLVYRSGTAILLMIVVLFDQRQTT